MARADEHFMTFDSLSPSEERSNFVTARMTTGAPTLLAVPPSFTTGPSLHDLVTTIRRPEVAIGRTELWSDERKKYVHDRWLHWQAIWDDPPAFPAYSPQLGE